MSIYGTDRNLEQCYDFRVCRVGVSSKFSQLMETGAAWSTDLKAVKELLEPLLVVRRRLRRIGTRGSLLSFAPLNVQRWVQTQRNSRAVQEGYRLVPEVALERKLVDALNFLTKLGSPASQLGDYLEFGVYQEGS